MYQSKSATDKCNFLGKKATSAGFELPPNSITTLYGTLPDQVVATKQPGLTLPASSGNEAAQQAIYNLKGRKISRHLTARQLGVLKHDQKVHLKPLANPQAR